MSIPRTFQAFRPVLFLCSLVLLVLLPDGGPSLCQTGAIVRLPEPRVTGSVSVEEALRVRRSVRSYRDESLPLATLSQILWAAQGITHERGLRTAPSGGALYPLELYVVASNVDGLDAGVYRYIPQGHRLEKLQDGDRRAELSKTTLGQDFVREGAFVLVFSAVYERITGKYGDRGVQYAHFEVGHAAQNVYLQAGALGLGTCVLGAFRDNDVVKFIGMKKGEQPLYLMPVGKMKR